MSMGLKYIIDAPAVLTYEGTMGHGANRQRIPSLYLRAKDIDCSLNLIKLLHRPYTTAN